MSGLAQALQGTPPMMGMSMAQMSPMQKAILMEQVRQFLMSPQGRQFATGVNGAMPAQREPLPRTPSTGVRG